MRGVPLQDLTSPLRSHQKLLSSVVIRQDHSATGGIHPLNASVAHGINVPRAISQALQEAAVSASDVDAIAVTRGPGMMQSLSNGMVAAKTLSSVLRKPLIYVHHMVAHALTPLFTEPEDKQPTFPFLTLLVSGGHTMLVLASGVSDYRILATTTDDSIG
jgi:N6-L-threonylcarbamoyladenine synthase